MTHQQESGMRPKPELYSSYYAEWFKDPDVIAAYPSRHHTPVLPWSFSANWRPIARAFDTELREVLTELSSSGEIRCVSDRLRLAVETTLAWGRPPERRTTR
jgi:hypothetical protein